MKKLFYNPRWMPSEETLRLFAVEVHPSQRIRTISDLYNPLRERYLALLANVPEKQRSRMLEMYVNQVPESGLNAQVNQILNCPQMTSHFGDLRTRLSGKPEIVEKFSLQQAQEIFRQSDLESLLSVLADPSA